MKAQKLTSKIIFSLLILLGFGLIVYSLIPEEKRFSPNKNEVTSGQTKKISPSQATVQGTTAPEETKSLSAVSTPVPSINNSLPTNSPIVSTSTSVTSTPASTPVNQQIQVNLSINGGGSFSVNVDQGNNQCDVLKKALEEGKINSLNMQYNIIYNSYAVYQINGIGKENSVWWVYTVNEISPTQGCSYIKANNGDNIEWKYIGS